MRRPRTVESGGHPLTAHLVLNKGAEKYIFRYEQGREAELLDALIDQVKDTRTDIDWFDAAVREGLDRRWGPGTATLRRRGSRIAGTVRAGRRRAVVFGLGPDGGPRDVDDVLAAGLVSRTRPEHAQDVPAAEFLRIGYLDRIVPVTGLDAAVQEVVDALAAGAPLALRGMKASLDEIARGEDDLARLRERETLCAGSEDLREGQAAMAQKRAPRFQGR